MFLAKVYISLKPTISDPQGQTILGGLHALGFESVEDIRVGKYMEIRIMESDRSRAHKAVVKMCDKLLANPVIEHYSFEVEDII